jgi:D-beta-D-heptose 7-phosphate kinase/D-beta-D-heptose 1-phosphate adenosyltransferase
MAVLAALSGVDYVVPFTEDTPQRLIELLAPDVLVKGGDYSVDQIAGHESVLARGGEVRILDFVSGHSTTNLIERLTD